MNIPGLKLRALPIFLIAIFTVFVYWPCTSVLSAAAPRSALAGEGEVSPEGEDTDRLHELADSLGEVFRHTAETVSPKVVWIETERKVEMERPGPGHPFEEFFGPPREEERQFRQQGLGSGFIIDGDGHILTNHHVVAGADKLNVKLPDGREFKAEIAGSDEATELAVIKLEGSAEGLPEPAEFGDSENLAVGEWVVAIGNPMGLSSTVSSGVVSAKGRSVGLARYENLIQTDAAINPGNSGGPLVNLRGEVVGINTAIISPTGGHMGIGLAIPINVAKPILDTMIAGEEVERGFLGFYGDELTRDLAESFGYDSTDGALVNEVMPDSPAEEAGIEPGDIVIKCDGEEIEDFSRLRMLAAGLEPGITVEIVVFRDGDKQRLDLEVGCLIEHEEGMEEREETLPPMMPEGGPRPEREQTPPLR